MGRKYLIPKNRQQFENMLVNAFEIGMSCGYAVEHTNLSEDERVYSNRYRALIQGKIKDMSEIVNDEKTYIEQHIE